MDTLTGIVERVTFHTEDTGFSVLKVKVRGRMEPVTVTGKVPAVHAGETISAKGEWINVADYGRQFKAEVIETAAPSSREGIERYLGSGLIEGIGPVYAKKLVDRFGEEIFEIIEKNSAKLEEVPGVGTKRRKEIRASWEKQKSIRSIMVFLHRHGISTGKAVKIYQAYGENAIERVQGDPWQLARDIHGIGFKTADAIAQKLGMAPDAPERLRAGLFHLLLAAGDEGHCALPHTELVTRAVALLDAAPERLEDILLRMMEDAELVRSVIDGTELIFPPHLARAESEIASRLRNLSGMPSRYPQMDVETELVRVQRETGRELGEGQRAAVTAALRSRALVITGGPGVGKTTILQCILRILGTKNLKFVLAAPTGRAARRMSESTGHEAKTIHRLLEYQPGTGFQKNRNSPLKGDLFVLDETSMVDVSLMMHWLHALPDNAHLLLVGDVDQLPSVGPGNVLADIIRSGLIPVARLTEIFRQAAESSIITAAHGINSGHVPSFPKPAPKGCDFHFIERDTPEAIQDTIVHLVRDRIPGAFELEPLRGIQVLSPMNRTPLGTNNLNLILQDALNPPAELKMEVERFGLTFRTGDKVIQTRNNYEKDVFNGDIGRVGDIESDPVRMHVHFDDGRSAIYESGDMDELRLAWAITIHKSQGSEFPAVVIPVSMQHFVMLQRNLLYTGITRGRKLVVLVGDPKALALAVKNTGATRRWGGLLQRMTGTV
ncbi:MAG TPA: ATP-dependent RecD-like DNA helicase [Verrucomicrobiales bacterium]|nr:ATP-dependent RecD-like DNA helicase [Verrucomicrobiales bacterium]